MHSKCWKFKSSVSCKVNTKCALNQLKFLTKGVKRHTNTAGPEDLFLIILPKKFPLLGDGCGHQEGSDHGEGQLQRLQVWRPHYKYCCCEHQSFKLQWSLPSFWQSVCWKNVKMCSSCNATDQSLVSFLPLQDLFTRICTDKSQWWAVDMWTKGLLIELWAWQLTIATTRQPF